MENPHRDKRIAKIHVSHSHQRELKQKHFFSFFASFCLSFAKFAINAIVSIISWVLERLFFDIANTFLFLFNCCFSFCFQELLWRRLLKSAKNCETIQWPQPFFFPLPRQQKKMAEKFGNDCRKQRCKRWKYWNEHDAHTLITVKCRCAQTIILNKMRNAHPE